MATTVTSIVDPSNQAGTDYTGLIAWDAGEYGDLTGVRDEISEASCRTSSSTADAFGTSQLSHSGWTVDSTRYCKIYSDSNNRPGTKFDTTKYHITYTGSSSAIVEHEDYTVWDGIQVDASGSTGNTFRVYGYDLSYEMEIKNCILKGCSTNYTRVLMGYVESGTDLFVSNCIIYDGTGTDSGADFTGGGNQYVYYNTIHNCDWGLNADSSSVCTAINNIINDCITDCVDRANMGSNSRNNIQNDIAYQSYFGVDLTTGTCSSYGSNKLIDSSKNFNTLGVKAGQYLRDDTGSNSSYVTAVDSDTQLSTNDDYFNTDDTYTIKWNFVGSVTFDDEANDDFALGSGDTAAKENGYDLSGDTNYPVSTDILGNTRDSSNPCIGAHELSSYPTLSTPMVALAGSTGAAIRRYSTPEALPLSAIRSR